MPEYLSIRDVNFGESINKRLFLKFLVLGVRVAYQKDGVNEYITFNMCDKGKEEEAVLFGVTDSQKEILRDGNVVIAAIDVREYRKSERGYSCIVYNVEKIQDNSQKYITWEKGVVWAKEEIERSIQGMKDGVYTKIAYSMLLGNWGKFHYYTAGESIHHKHLGGLLVHTADMLSLGNRICEHYSSLYGEDFIDRELLLASIILHDMGKVKELEVDKLTGVTKYSDKSPLIGHISEAVDMITHTAMRLGIGEKAEDKSDEQLNEEIEKVRLLKHCVLAHHGKREYGSPVTPSTVEALLLSKIDDISASINSMYLELENLEKGKTSSKWRGGEYRHVYKSEIEKGVGEVEYKETGVVGV